ncbi:MAG: glycogen synthase [Actinobacteria bacterium]|nr:glycogen synthase [Actinomycetota bacterium]
MAATPGASTRARSLRVLMLTAELVPYAKTGGLADVLGALPKALARLGVDVRVALPRYGPAQPGRLEIATIARDVPVPLGHASRLVNVGETTRDGLPVLFIENDHYFGRENIYGYGDDGERFVFFCRAALEAARALHWRPDVIHCHDWHTGLVPNWLRTTLRADAHYRGVASVFTIHNLAYQGHFGYEVLEAAGLQQGGFIPHPLYPDLSDVLIFIARGILFADLVTTVSARYAQEILTPEYGERLDAVLRDRQADLLGIQNGIDVDLHNPATDPALGASYTADDLAPKATAKAGLQRAAGLPVPPHVPLIGMVSPLADHKGFDILQPVLSHLLARDVQLVALGVGDPRYHDLLNHTARAYPSKAAAFLRFDATLAQRIYGGSDIFLTPSRHEPSGLGQLIALRYGSVPIVRATGGLADTVEDVDVRNGTGTGFVFPHYDPIDLFGAIARALATYGHRDAWTAIVRRGMRQDVSWERSARQYVAAYERAIASSERRFGA